MRVDRLSSLKQKLRRGSDSFDFAALIQGVSTIEAEPEARREGPEPGRALPAPEAVEAAAALIERAQEAPVDPEVAAQETAPAVAEVADDSQPALPLIDLPAGSDRLRLAAEALIGRFHSEVTQLAGALKREELGAAGLRLARVNQTLELLQSFDPTGDLARQYAIAGAPPPGRAWPRTAWSLAELAESPLSGLLPPGADDEFARRLLTIAWRAG